MSETGGTKPDVAGNRWGTTAPPNPITEPLGAKKDVGWAFGEKPAAAHMNWMLWISGLVDNWIDAAHIREFSDLNEAIAATTTPQLFRIGQPAAGNYLPKVDVFAPVTPASITGNISDVKTDGLRIYIRDDASNLVAIDPETGSELWNKTVLAGVSRAMAADGFGIYMATSVVQGFRHYDPSDGALLASGIGTIVGAQVIKSNGANAVAVDFAATTIFFYSGLGGTIVEDGTVAMGGNYVADDLAIDRNRVYVLARDTVANTTQVRCYDLATRGLLWTFNNPTVPAAKNIASIAADGEFIYLACDASTLSAPAWAAGDAYNALIIDRNGFFAAFADVGTLGDLVNVETDGGLCFFVDSAGVTRATSTRGLSLGYLWGQGDVVTTDVDGVSSCGFDSTNKVVRRRSADQPVTFQRVDGDDANRRPLHNLAIPMR